MSRLQIINSTDALSQLLNQAITIVENIQATKARFRGTPAHLHEYNDGLDSLLSTLWLVRDEPQLHTIAVQEQSRVIVDSAKTLQDQLDNQVVQLGKAKQYDHVSSHGDRGERDLEKTITELNRARADLNVRIRMAHVGLSGSMNSGVTAAVHVIRRVDKNVQRVLGSRLVIARQLEERGLLQDETGPVLLTNDDAKALGVSDKASWIENEAYDNAELFNSDLVEQIIQLSAERVYKGNKARGNSIILQGRANADAISALMRVRREPSCASAGYQTS